MKLTNRQQQKQDDCFCCKWKHIHRKIKFKQQMMKVLQKHMLEKNRYKKSNIYQELNACVKNKAL
jgi:hypothetical protein